MSRSKPSPGTTSRQVKFKNFSTRRRTRSYLIITHILKTTRDSRGVLRLFKKRIVRYVYSLLQWSLPDSTPKLRYFSRSVRPSSLSPHVEASMDRELVFGTNSANHAQGSELVAKPDPRFCNVMLAVMKVLYASGAADFLNMLREEDEHSVDAPCEMGVSSSFDGILSSKFITLEMSQSVVVNWNGIINKLTFYKSERIIFPSAFIAFFVNKVIPTYICQSPINVATDKVHDLLYLPNVAPNRNTIICREGWHALTSHK